MCAEVRRDRSQHWLVKQEKARAECDKRLRFRLGGDNRLAITLSSYVPNVDCDSSSVPFVRESCAIIERGMQVDDRQLLWGDGRTDPGIQEELPYELISSQPLPSPPQQCSSIEVSTNVQNSSSGPKMRGPDLQQRRPQGSRILVSSVGGHGRADCNVCQEAEARDR